MEPVGRVVLEDAVGVVEEVRPLADRRRERVDAGLAARRQEHRQVRAGDALPGQEVAERDQVDVVVGVHVADRRSRRARADRGSPAARG